MNDPSATPRLAEQASTPLHSKAVAIGLLLLVLALLVQAGSSAYHLRLDVQLLKNAIGQQQAAIDETARIRKQLDGIAGKTLQLEKQGNANAAMILERLRAAGVSIKTTGEQGEQ